MPGIGFDHTNHQEVAVHLLRTYHVVEPISEVAGRLLEGYWRVGYIYLFNVTCVRVRSY
jgi:hypothetical protein